MNFRLFWFFPRKFQILEPKNFILCNNQQQKKRIQQTQIFISGHTLREKSLCEHEQKGDFKEKTEYSL